MTQDKWQPENTRYIIYQKLSVSISTNADTVVAQYTHIGPRTFRSNTQDCDLDQTSSRNHYVLFRAVGMNADVSALLEADHNNS